MNVIMIVMLGNSRVGGILNNICQTRDNFRQTAM